MQQIIEKLKALEKSKSGSFVQNEPITPNELKQLQETLKFDIPQELLQLLQLYNGDCLGASLLGGFTYLLRPNDIIHDYLELSEITSEVGDLDEPVYGEWVDKRIKPYMWSKKWIPFLLANTLYYVIDLNPTESGIMGQIILVDWECSSNTFCAPSLRVFFEKIYELRTQGLDEDETAMFIFD